MQKAEEAEEEGVMVGKEGEAEVVQDVDSPGSLLVVATHVETHVCGESRSLHCVSLQGGAASADCDYVSRALAWLCLTELYPTKCGPSGVRRDAAAAFAVSVSGEMECDVRAWEGEEQADSDARKQQEVLIEDSLIPGAADAMHVRVQRQEHREEVGRGEKGDMARGRERMWRMTRASEACRNSGGRAVGEGGGDCRAVAPSRDAEREDDGGKIRYSRSALLLFQGTDIGCCENQMRQSAIRGNSTP